jgi:hypothetical protein
MDLYGPFDVARLPGQTARYDHGFLQPHLFEGIAAAFARYLAAHPDFVHNR